MGEVSADTAATETGRPNTNRPIDPSYYKFGRIMQSKWITGS